MSKRKFSDEAKQQLQQDIKGKLNDLGENDEDGISEIIITMLQMQKEKKEYIEELEALLGKEASQELVDWLFDVRINDLDNFQSSNQAQSTTIAYDEVPQYEESDNEQQNISTDQGRSLDQQNIQNDEQQPQQPSRLVLLNQSSADPQFTEEREKRKLKFRQNNSQSPPPSPNKQPNIIYPQNKVIPNIILPKDRSQDPLLNDPKPKKRTRAEMEQQNAEANINANNNNNNNINHNNNNNNNNNINSGNDSNEFGQKRPKLDIQYPQNTNPQSFLPYPKAALRKQAKQNKQSFTASQGILTPQLNAQNPGNFLATNQRGRKSNKLKNQNITSPGRNQRQMLFDPLNNNTGFNQPINTFVPQQPHTFIPQNNQIASGSQPIHPVPCRYGQQLCQNQECTFFHGPPCREDSQCKNPKCAFAHYQTQEDRPMQNTHFPKSYKLVIDPTKPTTAGLDKVIQEPGAPSASEVKEDPIKEEQ
ncbi:MAG: hypothetical protein EZS28_003266 [Streblomastix strix]|uniref:Uncharacterized protein n=1 Tax=Streblomastix strix TaxID=222440 RepID=A0A5J4X3I2_9EUKA|nr:MAG: hypothetical protein EZS28_003266 [Streblomastix strix]